VFTESRRASDFPGVRGGGQESDHDSRNFSDSLVSTVGLPDVRGGVWLSREDSGGPPATSRLSLIRKAFRDSLLREFFLGGEVKKRFFSVCPASGDILKPHVGLPGAESLLQKFNASGFGGPGWKARCCPPLLFTLTRGAEKKRKQPSLFFFRGEVFGFPGGWTRGGPKGVAVLFFGVFFSGLRPEFPKEEGKLKKSKEEKVLLRINLVSKLVG